MASRAPQVKNRAPAPVQITAEQLLRIARDTGIEDAPKAPKQFIADKEELLYYQQTKRRDFEDQIRRQRQHIGIWCRYALWEAGQKEFERARSIFERALDVDPRSQTLWMKYADMEMKNKFINHARNIWDRATSILPRVDTFWYKYSYMEELAGVIDNARQVFERWMAWDPDDLAWAAYIKFEMRQSKIDRARALYERYISQLPTSRAYLKYAHWEEKNRERGLARNVYERSLSELHPFERTEKLLLNFARFEERCKEFDRARVIYQYAMKQQSEGDASQLTELKQEYLAFEKRHGNKVSIDDAIITQRREHYEQLVAKDAFNYDSWFDYIRLEEAEKDSGRIRAVYERAVGNVPPIAEKRYWRRYIYLWINYAIYEELSERDIERARAVYKKCLAVIPNKLFTFGKIWLMAAKLEVRQKDLPAARKILGQGIGMCGKENIFKVYIELEHQLGEIDRCRTLYGKYIERMPFSCSAWKAFAQLEASLEETARARAIYELAVSQYDLDMPEVLWKAYIDFEIAEKNVEQVRRLYERLLDRANHVKVWISFGQFEMDFLLSGEKLGTEQLEEGIAVARSVFARGYDALKRQGLKEERALLLEAWRDVEKKAVDSLRAASAAPSVLQAAQDSLEAVESKFPRKVKMRRSEEDVAGGAEAEFYEYLFPDDEKKIMGMKLLEKAMLWKKAEGNGEDTALGKRKLEE